MMLRFSGLTKALAGPAAAAIALTTTAQAYDAAQTDPFMSIHMDNQKIGSDVYNHWHARAMRTVRSGGDPYMVIHMDNQKIGSPVSTFWRSLAERAD